MSDDWTILSTFGTLELTSGSGEALLPTGKPVALIAYLELAPGRRATREHLASLLWSDLDPERARATLRQTLTTIRRALGADAVASDNGLVGVTAPLRCDAVLFLDAISSGDWAAAVELYRGDFIPDFAIPGGVSFEHWRDVEATRLRALFLRAAEVRVHDLIAAVDTAGAVAVARRAAESDRNDEGARRQLIETLVAAGQVDGATVEAARLTREFQADERELEPATRSLVRRLTAQAATSANAEKNRHRLQPGFIGRESAFASVLRAWQRARGGRTSLMTIVAPPGFGKTRLLDETASRLRIIGGRVARISSRRNDRGIAGVSAADLVSVLASLPGASGITPDSAAILTELAPGAATALRVANNAAPIGASVHIELPRRRALALADLFGAVAHEGVLVVLCDDWQWSDTESQRMIEAAIDRIPHVPMLLVLASRSQPGITPDVRLDLPTLSAQHTRALLQSIADVEADDALDTTINLLHQSTAGIPLLLLQALYGMRDRGWLDVEADRWVVNDAHAMHRALGSMRWIDARLQGTAADAQRLLSVLEAAERPVHVALLARTIDSDEESVKRALDALEDRGLVVCERDEWEIAHDEIGVAIGAQRTPAAAAADHAALARAVASNATTPEECRALARHAIAGGVPRLLIDQLTLLRNRDALPRLPVARLLELYVGIPLDPLIASRVRSTLNADRRRRYWMTASVVAAILIAFLAVRAAVEPVELRFIRYPVARQAGALFEVPPVVEAVTRFGTRVPFGHVWVELSTADSNGRLDGNTRVKTSDGIAAFDSVRVLRVYPPPRLRFRAPGLRALEFDMTTAEPHLEITGGELNGVRLDGSHHVWVPASDRLRGWIQLRYSTPWSGASVMLAGLATWQERTSDTLDVMALITPVEGARVVVHIDRAAPTGAASAHLVWAFAAEPSARDIASGTNWKCSQTTWHDGNDLADLSAATLDSLTLSGRAELPWDYCDDAPTGRHRTNRLIGFAALRVSVGGAKR